jgi:hypothetical protein
VSRVSVYLKWYDLWAGVYIDRKNKLIYVGIPCVGLCIDYSPNSLYVARGKGLNNMANLYGIKKRILESDSHLRGRVLEATFGADRKNSMHVKARRR